MPLPQRYQFIVMSYGSSSIDFGPEIIFNARNTNTNANAHNHSANERTTGNKSKWLESMNCETKNEWKNDTNDLINKFSFSASSVSHFIGFDSLGFAIWKRPQPKINETKWW